MACRPPAYRREGAIFERDASMKLLAPDPWGVYPKRRSTHPAWQAIRCI